MNMRHIFLSTVAVLLAVGLPSQLEAEVKAPEGFVALARQEIPAKHW